MAKSKRERIKGRKEKGAFLRLPKAIINSPKFYTLSGNATKLLIQVASQYNGYNNGDLQASYHVLKHQGWRSENTLNRARKELLEAGFLVKTRQGRMPKICSLFAITWVAIDERPAYKFDAGIHEYIGKNLGWWDAKRFTDKINP